MRASHLPVRLQICICILWTVQTFSVSLFEGVCVFNAHTQMPAPDCANVGGMSFGNRIMLLTHNHSQIIVCVCVGDVWPNEGKGEIALMWSANHRTRAGIDCSLPVHNFFVFCVLQFIECIFLSLFRGYRRFLLDWRRIIAWFFNWLSFVCENERALGVTVTSASRHQQSPTSPLQLSISELCSE